MKNDGGISESDVKPFILPQNVKVTDNFCVSCLVLVGSDSSHFLASIRRHFLTF